jgi:hypothetical protein
MVCVLIDTITPQKCSMSSTALYRYFPARHFPAGIGPLPLYFALDSPSVHGLRCFRGCLELIDLVAPIWRIRVFKARANSVAGRGTEINWRALSISQLVVRRIREGRKRAVFSPALIIACN